jgi:type II secretory pathway pseudopilin PulG
MAAERTRGKPGFALFAVIMTVLVFAVAATIVVTTLSGNNEEYRIEKAADVLHRFAAEIDTARSGANLQSFRGQVGVYPSRLSQLYTKILSSDVPCLGTGTFGTTAAGNWKGPYHLVPVSQTGYNVAPGFFANDLLSRVSSTIIAIQMPNSSLRDAQSLELFVDRNGKSDGTGPVVVFALTDPTTINYRISALTTGC